MSRLKREMVRLADKAAKLVGLPRAAERRYRRTFGIRSAHDVVWNGRAVHFKTEDEFSRRWFYARYGAGRVIEQQMLDMIGTRAEKSRCFVDVGANLGLYSCLALAVNPSIVVHAFELDDGNCALLRRNLALNAPSRWTVHQVALSNASGQTTYSAGESASSPLNRACFAMTTAPGDAALTSTARAARADAELARSDARPDLVKIDVQGAELLVLQGFGDLLDAPDLEIYVELHPTLMPQYGTIPRQALELLLRRGLRLWRIPDESKTDVLVVATRREMPDRAPFRPLTAITSPTLD